MLFVDCAEHLCWSFVTCAAMWGPNRNLLVKYGPLKLLALQVGGDISVLVLQYRCIFKNEQH